MWPVRHGKDNERRQGYRTAIVWDSTMDIIMTLEDAASPLVLNRVGVASGCCEQFHMGTLSQRFQKGCDVWECRRERKTPPPVLLCVEGIVAPFHWRFWSRSRFAPFDSQTDQLKGNKEEYMYLEWQQMKNAWKICSIWEGRRFTEGLVQHEVTSDVCRYMTDICM